MSLDFGSGGHTQTRYAPTKSTLHPKPGNFMGATTKGYEVTGPSGAVYTIEIRRTTERHLNMPNKVNRYGQPYISKSPPKIPKGMPRKELGIVDRPGLCGNEIGHVRHTMVGGRTKKKSSNQARFTDTNQDVDSQLDAPTIPIQPIRAIVMRPKCRALIGKHRQG